MACWFGTEPQVEARRAYETVNRSLMCLNGLSVRGQRKVRKMLLEAGEKGILNVAEDLATLVSEGT